MAKRSKACLRWFRLLGWRARIPPRAWMFVLCVLYSKDKRQEARTVRTKKQVRIKHKVREISKKSQWRGIMHVCFLFFTFIWDFLSLFFEIPMYLWSYKLQCLFRLKGQFRKTTDIMAPYPSSFFFGVGGGGGVAALQPSPQPINPRLQCTEALWDCTIKLCMPSDITEFSFVKFNIQMFAYTPTAVQIWTRPHVQSEQLDTRWLALLLVYN